MANGDVTVKSLGQIVIKLLDGASGGGDNGQWVDAGEYDIGVVIATGATGAATVEIDGSNDLVMPANNTHGAPLAAKSAAATATAFQISCCPRWIKARIVDAGTGTVNAIAVLRSNAQG